MASTGMTTPDQPTPPSDGERSRRLTDAERPVRRVETGTYSRRSA